jgi:hypothetical protein
MLKMSKKPFKIFFEGKKKTKKYFILEMGCSKNNYSILKC